MGTESAVVLVMIADDVRLDIDGKTLIVGGYASTILVPQFPNVMPTFAVYIELKPEKHVYERAAVLIKNDKGEILTASEGRIEFQDLRFHGSLNTKFSPVVFNLPGEYYVYLGLDEEPVQVKSFQVVNMRDVKSRAA
jgi:hypothetical protein